MKQRLDKHFLLNRAFVGTLLAIAVPIALQNMISFGVAVMDSVMLGSFGDVAIAAANLGGQPFSILMSFGFGLSSGGSVLIAQYWGKGDIGRIRKVMRISMQLVFLASLGITVVCLLMPEGILRIFTKDEAIVQAGAGYLALVAFSYIPYSLSNNYMMSLRAVEKVKISTAIYGVSFFVNVFFNYAFIFGKFGAPRLEVRGAAVGTIFARCSELVMVLIYMYFRENTVGFRMHDCLKFDREMLPSYTRHSLPVLGNELLWGVGFVATSVLYNVTPETYEAAYTIIGVLACLQLVLGIDVTCIVGILRGGGDTRTAFVYDCGALWLVSIPMGILAGLVLHLPVPLVYVCLKLDSPIKAFLSLLRIRSGKWIRNVTVQTSPMPPEEEAQRAAGME